jgi:hypothetical protein
MKLRAVIAGVGFVLGAGCSGDLTAEEPLVELDRAYFRCRVQPVLTKSCSALVCHGDPRRYFRVYARNRLRLGGSEAERNALLRDSESAFDFASARAYVDPNAPEESYLLLKPLDQRAGGLYHGGAEEFGQGDVFLDRDDPDFETLEAWIHGEKEDPACIEPGSDL